MLQLTYYSNQFYITIDDIDFYIGRGRFSIGYSRHKCHRSSP